MNKIRIEPATQLLVFAGLKLQYKFTNILQLPY